MANPEHVALVLKVDDWRRWREKYPNVTPELSWANLVGVNLSVADLHGADLSRADFSKANLSETAFAFRSL
jgi:uncharacterized protein YjbI with pentapeptide repeats